MKLLFVGTNPENTGAASHFVALVQAMVEAGHDVCAVVYPDSLMWQGLSHSKVRLYPGQFRNVFDLRGYAAVFKAARQLKPDWLIGNSGKEYWPLILMGRCLRIPVALFRHRTLPMKRFSARWVPRLAQRFLTVSNNARQAYLDQGIPGELVRMLYNPVNMALCQYNPQQRSDIWRSLGLDDDAIVLGYSGRMHNRKGIFPLFEAATAAMAMEPRLHCVWLGDGPEAQTLRERADAHSTAARHHFPGWINDVHPWYSAFSMLAFPSIATETFGRVSVEAQAAGVPVLASDIGGIPETLDAGVSGLLLPPGNVTAWRDAILMLCDPALRIAMGVAAYSYVQEHFSTRVIADAFQQILLDG